MCLTIDYIKHPDLKPIKLDKDLVVTKFLIDKSFRDWSNLVPLRIRAICNIATPYRHKPIYFLFGKCILRAKLDKPQEHDYLPNRFTIDKGIHAFTMKGFAYPAIVPKGTLVYYGLNGDIVVEKLIIYKDKKKWQQLK